ADLFLGVVDAALLADARADLPHDLLDVDAVRADGKIRHIVQPRGFAPRTPLHALSRAASPARSVRVAHSLRSFALRGRPGLSDPASTTPGCGGRGRDPGDRTIP